MKEYQNQMDRVSSTSQRKENTEGEIISYLGEVSRRRIEIQSDLEKQKRSIEELNKESKKIQDSLNQINEQKKDIQREIDKLSAEMNSLNQEHKRLTNILYNLIPKRIPETVSINDEVKEKKFRALSNEIRKKLRKCIHSNQLIDEKYIQDGLASLLSVLEIPFNRENVGIPHATVMRKPDFTLRDFPIAIEVKLLHKKERLSKIIDEIGADKEAYKKTYDRLLFIIYDHGVIQDIDGVTKDLEDSTTLVIIVKH